MTEGLGRRCMRPFENLAHQCIRDFDATDDRCSLLDDLEPEAVKERLGSATDVRCEFCDSEVSCFRLKHCHQRLSSALTRMPT